MADLSFMAGGRRRRLSRETKSGPFIIRFQVDGKELHRSTGTTEVPAAKEIARRLVEAELSGNIEESRRLKVRSDYCRLRQVCDIYVAKFGTDDRRKRTANGNVGCLQKILKHSGLTLDAKVDVLGSALIRQFEKVEEKRIKKDDRGNMDQSSERSVRESLCSTVRQARSIFKRGTMSWFEDLVLPSLDEFRNQSVTAPDRPLPRPLEDGVIEQVNAAAPLLAKTNPACYVSHLLFKQLGMRNAEQKFARRSWIRRKPDGSGALGVIYRPEESFKPKKKTERWIPIAPSVLQELDRYYQPSPDGEFLVPAAHKSERADIIDDQHSAWVGQWIKNRSKTSYELRRYAGSLLFDKLAKSGVNSMNALAYVQKFLGHANMATTLAWYWYLIDDVPAIDLEDCAPKFAVVA